MLESRDSSSPIITRSVAAGLSRHSVRNYNFPAWQRAGLRLLGRLPKEVALWLIPKVQAPGAVDSQRVWSLTIQELIEERLADYSQLEGRFPAVTLGVGMGGTTAHLSLALGGPFLPQAFVITMKGGSLRGDAQEYFELSADLANRVVANNPGVMSIQHFDPVHDGWLTKNINHLRLKLIDLPESYKQFLRQHLELGGTVCYLEGGASWLRYRTGPRSVFQVGGWGDISPEEFVNGSDRLASYALQNGFPVNGWRLLGYPLEIGPESEWGSEPGLGEALEVFCKREGFKFSRICFHDPNDFSRLAFHAVWQQIKKSGHEPAGTIIETFSQYDASAVLQTSLLPLWLIFNTKDSLRFLQGMKHFIPTDKPLFFSPLATFSITPDLVPWRDWESALDGLPWINIGTKPSHYPADPSALVDWQEPLRKWAKANPKPVQSFLSIEELEELAQTVQLQRIF